ncbi:MAG: GNAT family N-acetyltransferase [Steroidobacteraceae bacterium]
MKAPVMDSTEYEISSDTDRIDLDLVHEFLSKSYWAQGRSRDAVAKSIQHSLCFGVYGSGRQVAFARVITDRTVFAYLADVFVVTEFRGRGIAKMLMREILEHPDLQNLRLFFLGTRDAHGLYTQFGFSPFSQPERMMAIYNPNSDVKEMPCPIN